MCFARPAADPTAILSLKVMQHTSILPHQLLGSVDIQIKTVIEMQEDSGEVTIMFIHNINSDILSDVILKLQGSQHDTEFQGEEAGSIAIHFIQEETDV